MPKFLPYLNLVNTLPKSDFWLSVNQAREGYVRKSLDVHLVGHMDHFLKKPYKKDASAKSLYELTKPKLIFIIHLNNK